MLGTTNWQNQDFLKIENYKKILAAANDCWSFDEEKDAMSLYRNILEDKIDFLLRLEDKQLASDYKQIIFKIIYIALPRLATDEVAKWFGSNLLEFLSLDGEIPLKDKIRKHLAQEIITTRDGLKMVLARAMETNEQALGGKNIGGWLKDYRLFLADNRNDRRLAQVEYLSRRLNILSVEEKEAIVKLLNIYDFLHLSSFIIEGNEDAQLIKDNDGYYGLYKGEIFKINFGVAKTSKDKTANTVYNVKKDTVGRPGLVPAMEDKLHQELNNFLKSQIMTGATRIKSNIDGFDLKTLRNHFYQSVNAGKGEEAVAALLLLAESGKLKEAFAGDERFVKFWGDYLIKNNLAGGEFVKDPANAKDLARFLQYILEGRLKMKSDEAAMIGVLVSNAARAAYDLDYKALAYGDMESGEFRWNV